jgi:predicted transport protein
VLQFFMPVTEIEIYEALKEQIGDKPARILLEYIETKTEKEFEKKKDVLATKQDIELLRTATKQDIAELRADLEVKIEQSRIATKQDIELLRTATKQDIAELRADLEVKIEQSRSAAKQDIAQLEVKIERVRADLIRWMFIFWAGQIGALIAILALFFK